jgi:hypothetical protein
MKPTHHHDTKTYRDYYIHQDGKGYPVFAGRRYQRGHGLGSIFGGLFKAAMPLFEKGSKDPRTRGFKNGVKYCRRCRTRKKYQTGSEITIEINRTKLTPGSYGHGRIPRTTSYKRTCQAKKDQTSADQATKHIE